MKRQRRRLGVFSVRFKVQLVPGPGWRQLVRELEAMKVRANHKRAGISRRTKRRLRLRRKGKR